MGDPFLVPPKPAAWDCFEAIALRRASHVYKSLKLAIGRGGKRFLTFRAKVKETADGGGFRRPLADYSYVTSNRQWNLQLWRSVVATSISRSGSFWLHRDYRGVEKNHV